jgi:L-iditol 2-dehydrogenase
MRAIQFVGPRQVALRHDVPVPSIGEGEALVHCSHVALCGSNMGPYLGEGAWAGTRWPAAPGWTGHENVGTIVQSRCPEWSEGTEVLAVPRGYDGFTEYIASRQGGLAKLPDHAPDRGIYVAAQPLATVLHALSRVPPPAGQTWAVLGQGPIGLIFTHLLSRMGAARIFAADPVATRLDWAVRLGATDTVDVSRQDVVQTVRELTDGAMVDVSVEASGNSEAIAAATRLPRRYGKLLPFGVSHHNTEAVPWLHINRQCIEIVGSNGVGGPKFLRAAVDLMARGAADLGCLITPRLPWHEAAQAFDMYAHPAAHPAALKVTLAW